MSFSQCIGQPSIIIPTFFFQDYKTFGRTTPTLDASQDYILLNASEAGGYTQLIFERPRDTGDENDFAFMVSEGKGLREGARFQNVLVVTNSAAYVESQVDTQLGSKEIFRSLYS